MQARPDYGRTPLCFWAPSHSEGELRGGGPRLQRMAQAPRARAGPRLGSSAAGNYLHRRRVQADLAGHVQHAAPGSSLRVRPNARGRPR